MSIEQQQQAPPGPGVGLPPPSSGRVFVIGTVTFMVLLVVSILVFGPRLRTATFGRAQSLNVIEQLDTGSLDNREYIVSATDDENGTCVEVEFPPLRPRGTCANLQITNALQGLRIVTSPVTRTPVVMAVLGSQVAAIEFELVGADPITTDVFDTTTEFPAAFAVAVLPPGARVAAVSALAGDGQQIERRECPREDDPEGVLGDGCNGLEARRT